MSQSPILTVEASYRTDILSLAQAIEIDCHEHLLAPPKGVYCQGKLEPVMVDGQNYYHNKTGSLSELVTDINTVDTAVYNESGKCVIPLYYMKKRSAMIGNDPFLPYRGLHVLRELVINQIDRSRAYRKYPKDKYASISKHFQPGLDVNNVCGEMLDDLFKPLEGEIELFIGNTNWDMYFIKLANTVLIVERNMDYRAYCWEMEHGDEWRSGRYHPPA